MASKILEGLKDALLGRGRVVHIMVRDGKTRPMTPAEAEAIDEGFRAMNAGFDAMSRAFDKIK